MPSAARSARCAWSSWAIGAPKSAITPSPRNWLTVPSYAWTEARMISKHRSMISWTASGSSRDASEVKPEISVNSTVTCLRSPSMAPAETRIFSARCFGVYACAEAKRSSIGRAGAASPGAPARASMANGRSGSRTASGGAGEALGRPGPPATGASVARRCPHSLQNLLAAAFDVPQERQTSPKRVPHSPQNLAASGLSWPH